MAAHLYGDLPESKQPDSEGSAAAWSNVAKAPSQTEPESQESQEMPKIEPVAKQSHLAPPSVVKKQNRTATTSLDVHMGQRETEGVKYGYSLFGDIENEYDPEKPNDYEAVIAERERKRQEAELEAEKQELLRQQERERKEKRQITFNEAEEDARANRRKLSTNESSFNPAVLPLQTGAGSVHAPCEMSMTGEGKGMGLAQKMLEKYGWKEGEGLGKERQGMATPLIAQKTDKRRAVIVKAQQIVKPQAPEPTKPQVPPLRGTSTRVLLLRNLVGPGEVDDDLEDEVAEELQKYGQVQRVLIFEVTESNFPPEEAVRIFVEFKTTDEAHKAATALNGRFFGGRNVRAGYYDEAKFASCDLAPVSGEFQ